MVAASREHFSYNPFIPPVQSDNVNGHRQTIDEFIDRTKPGPPDSYLSRDNRYYKMIDREMASGESAANIYQLRRSYVREKKNGLCPTLTANRVVAGTTFLSSRDSWGIRRLSVEEVAGLQGFVATESLFPDIPAPEKYRLLGNAVCVHLAQLVGRACADILDGKAG